MDCKKGCILTQVFQSQMTYSTHVLMQRSCFDCCCCCQEGFRFDGNNKPTVCQPTVCQPTVCQPIYISTSINMSSSTATTTITIDLIEPILKEAQTTKLKEAAPLKAHGLYLWLVAFYFPTKIRKSKEYENVEVTSPKRGLIQILLQKKSNDTNNKEDDNDTNNIDISNYDNNNTSILQKEWEKSIRTTLKKITVEDLGQINATELLPTIPQQDPEGRGIDDLKTMERKLNVKVVFDIHETDHVLIVGDTKKLEKKVFAIRNMISHYHWRLSGKDTVGT